MRAALLLSKDTQHMGVDVCKELVLNTFTPQHSKHACAHNHFSHHTSCEHTEEKKFNWFDISGWIFRAGYVGKKNSVAWNFQETQTEAHNSIKKHLVWLVKTWLNKYFATYHTVFLRYGFLQYLMTWTQISHLSLLLVIDTAPP